MYSTYQFNASVQGTGGYWKTRFENWIWTCKLIFYLILWQLWTQAPAMCVCVFLCVL